MKKSNLWIDLDQGESENGKAFGYVGIHGVGEYKGWFFSWPRQTAGIRTTGERCAVIESLEEETESAPFDAPAIPLRWVRAALLARLKKDYDLRRTAR